MELKFLAQFRDNVCITPTCLSFSSDELEIVVPSREMESNVREAREAFPGGMPRSSQGRASQFKSSFKPSFYVCLYSITFGKIELK